jgi:hypothetical protein
MIVLSKHFFNGFYCSALFSMSDTKNCQYIFWTSRQPIAEFDPELKGDHYKVSGFLERVPKNYIDLMGKRSSTGCIKFHKYRHFSSFAFLLYLALTT